MKKYLFIISAILLFSHGCNPAEEIDKPTKQIDIPEIPSVEINEIKATFIQNADSNWVASNEPVLFWQPEDRIKLFVGVSSAEFITNIKATANEAVFYGSIKPDYRAKIIRGLFPGTIDARYTEVVPFSKEATLNIQLPNTQKAETGSFDRKAMIAVASSEISDTVNLKFNALCGGIRFTVTGTGINSVELQGSQSEIIAGDISIEYNGNDYKVVKKDSGSKTITILPPDGTSFQPNKWYYIVSLPVTFNNGINLFLYKGKNRAKYAYPEELVINPGLFESFEAIDNNMCFVEVMAERDVLIDLYNSTNGSNWTRNDNWCSDKPLSEWYGVTVNWTGNVSGLYLEGNNLIGTIPESIGCLDDLLDLSLYGNLLAGSIPESICNLTSIKHLYLHNNLLGGTLPENIGNMKSLTNLDIGSYSIIGTVAEGQIPDFYKEGADHNHISGHIPESISKLKKLLSFGAPSNQLEGPIPDGLWDIPGLIYVYLGDNNIGGEIPKSISHAQNLVDLDMSNCNLTGEIPHELFELKNLESLRLGNTDYISGIGKPEYYNSLSGTIPPNIDGLINIYSIDLSKNKLTGSIPTQITKLKNISSLSLGSNMISGIIPENIGDLHNLTSFWIDYNDIEGNLPESMKNLSKLEGFLASNNRLSGRIPDVVVENPNFPNWKIEPQQEGYGLSIDMYCSTDYSQDGNLKVLQTATKGKGINLVFMGDAFCDNDIGNGVYDDVIEEAVDAFFSNEPYRSMRDYFNVFEVTVVSPNNNYYPTANRALETAFGANTYVYGNHGKVETYARNAIGENDMDECTIVVLMNREYYAGTSFLYYPENVKNDNGRGLGIAYLPLGTDHDMFSGLVQHEAGGHAFAKLDDEYFYESYGTVPDDWKKARQSFYQDWGWWPNVDFTSNQDSVKWVSYISDPRYLCEKISVFEGGSTYVYGVWRPTENSMMRYNDCPFNAPSREAIYRRINSLAYGENWKFDYETFVNFDAPSRQTTKAIRPEQRVQREPLHSPVVVQNSK